MAEVRGAVREGGCGRTHESGVVGVAEGLALKERRLPSPGYVSPPLPKTWCKEALVELSPSLDRPQGGNGRATPHRSAAPTLPPLLGGPSPFGRSPPPSPSIPIEGLPLAVRAAVLGFCGTPAKTDAAVARYAAPKERCCSASARTQSVRLGQQLLYGQRADCPDGCRVTVS